jgi:hypothetical protein
MQWRHSECAARAVEVCAHFNEHARSFERPKYAAKPRPEIHRWIPDGGLPVEPSTSL